MATVGIGYDIQPDNQTETVFTMLAIFIGLFLFATVIGSMSNLLANMDIVSVKHKQQTDLVSNFLNKVCPSLSSLA